MFRPVRRDYVVKILMLLSRSLVLCFFEFGTPFFSPPSYNSLLSLALFNLFSLQFWNGVDHSSRALSPLFPYLSLMAT